MFRKNFCIEDRLIGENTPAFIVAEAGVAHFGKLKKALDLVDLAVSARADAVKFQVFRTDELVSKNCKKWRKRLSTKELSFKDFRKIQSYCRKRKIIFFATAHDEKSLSLLNELKVPAYKIGSGEINNWGFFKKVASSGKPVIFSTGMYALKQVDKALETIAGTGNKDVAILHCVTRYPASSEEVNLRAIGTMHKLYKLPVGYSDHTKGFHMVLAAVAVGASIIEKHITLDFSIPNAQDWKVSCGPEDLERMIKQIRDIEAGLGSGRKIPSRKEKLNLIWARKSLVAVRDILPGELITQDKICAKRPGTGILPSDNLKLIGKKSKKMIKKDSIIKWEQII